MELDDIKRILHATAPAYEKEIKGLMNAARADLRESGVIDTPEAAYIINQAVLLYCKAFFGYQEPVMMEKYIAAYEHMKSGLVLRTQGAKKK